MLELYSHLTPEELNEFFIKIINTPLNELEQLLGKKDAEKLKKEVIEAYKEFQNIPMNERKKIFEEMSERLNEEAETETDGEEVEDEIEYVMEEIEELSFEADENGYFDSVPDEDYDYAESIFAYIGEVMYYCYDKRPFEWDKETMKRCLINEVPARIPESDGFFRALVPVLREYFRFMEEKHGEEYEGMKGFYKEIDVLADVITTNAANPELWVQEKKILKEALKKGIDIEDEEEFGKFMKQYGN